MIDDHAIAIIGMSCRLPTCDGIDQLWPMLLDGRRRTNFTSERPHRVAPFHENLLDGIEEFDPFAFGISPREAAEMDPQQRLLLHVGAEALYDAGMTPAGTAGSRTACYVGALWSDYLSRQRLQPDPSSYSACNTLSFLANRLSYVFDWSGPSVTIDTACSSSLVAVEFACRALISGDAGLAMVAGVNLILHPQSTLAIRKLGAMSSVGVCRPFDRSADGLVRAEGCGAVVLKRAWDLTENDRAYALIHSGALTHTGRGPSMMTPSTEAYLDLFERAFASGSGTPSEVGYYEAHGTGTKLGDSAELAGVEAFLGRFPRSGGPCRIGSIKGVFGHCEGAAGIMGLISTALSIHRRTIPPLVVDDPITAGSAEAAGVEFAASPTPWPDDAPLAAVSSFGLGGSGCCSVLGPWSDATFAHFEYPGFDTSGALAIEAPDAELEAKGESHLFAFNAPDPEKFAKYRDRLSTAIEGRMQASSIAAALHTRPTTGRFRWAHVTDSVDELRALIAEARPTDAQQGARAKICFVYSGSGGEWPCMGLSLLSQPSFRSAFEQCDAIIRDLTRWSARDMIEMPNLGSRPEISHLTQIAVQIALTKLLEDWGIRPELVVGYSLGELAAAWASEALPLADVLELVHRRGLMLKELIGFGRTALLGCAVDALPTLPPTVTISGINGPQATVLSGAEQALDAVCKQVADRGVFVRKLQLPIPVHGPMVDPLLPKFVDEISGLAFSTPKLPWISTAGARAGSLQSIPRAEHWGFMTREPVDFVKAFEAAVAKGAGIFIEVGPHPTLLHGMKTLAGGTDDMRVTVHSTLSRGEDDYARMLVLAAELWERGADVDIGRFGPQSPPATLPPAPWDAARHWISEDGPPLPGPKSVPGLGDVAEDVARQWRYVASPMPSIRALDELAIAAFARSFHELGIGGPDVRGQLARLVSSGRVRGGFEKYLGHCAGILGREGVLRGKGDDMDRLEAEGRCFEQRYHAVREEWGMAPSTVELLARCGRRLTEILAGVVPATDVFFPNGDIDSIEPFYQSEPMFRCANQMAAAVARAAVDRLGRCATLLELGAGTGATTSFIAPQFRSGQVRYVFSDVSTAFLARARHKFRELDFIDYDIVDMENPEQSTSIGAGEVDVLIATNCIHACRDIGTVLRKLEPLLRADGLLILSELSDIRPWSSLIGGILDGFNLFDDEIRLPRGQPLLFPEEWVAVLEANGFGGIEVLPSWQPRDLDTGQRLYVARPKRALLHHATAALELRESSRESSARSVSDESRHVTAVVEPREPLEILRTLAARALMADPERVNTNRPLTMQGMDSLSAAQFAREARARFGVDLIDAQGILTGISLADIVQGALFNPVVAGSHEWFPIRDRQAAAPLRLICFPHAGGNASMFLSWQSLFGAQVDVCAIQLPRSRREDVQDLRALARMAYEASIATLDEGAFAVFGHSFGAILAFEFARMADAGGHSPNILVVSGSWPPWQRDPRKPTHTMSDEEFDDEVRARYGVSIDMSPELRRNAMQNLRDDLRLRETYEYLPFITKCPIEVFGGVNDPIVSIDQLHAWKKRLPTTRRVHEFEVGHYWIGEDRGPALALLGILLASVGQTRLSPGADTT